MTVVQRAGKAKPTEVASPTVFDLDGSNNAGGKKVRLPEMALGLLLVVGCALGALWWQARSFPTTSILVAATDIERGQLITADNLKAVELRSGEPVATIGAEEAESLVGKVAVGDIPQDSIFSTGMVAATTTLGPDEAIVGLLVAAGRIPSVGLATGSLVQVLSSEANADNEGVLIETAEVVEVVQGGGFGEMLVSLRVSQDEARRAALASAAAPVIMIELGDP